MTTISPQVIPPAPVCLKMIIVQQTSSLSRIRLNKRGYFPGRIFRKDSKEKIPIKLYFFKKVNFVDVVPNLTHYILKTIRTIHNLLTYYIKIIFSKHLEINFINFGWKKNAPHTNKINFILFQWSVCANNSEGGFHQLKETLLHKTIVYRRTTTDPKQNTIANNITNWMIIIVFKKFLAQNLKCKMSEFLLE